MSGLTWQTGKDSLHTKIVSAEETVSCFENGMGLGWSVFPLVGYPKVVPEALADYVEANGLHGTMRMETKYLSPMP